MTPDTFVFFEGSSKLSLKRQDTSPLRQMMGRTPCDRIVVWDGNERQIGQMLDLLIHDASGTTLFGNVETVELAPQLYAIGRA